MRKAMVLCLLATLVLMMGGCWLWENPTPQRTPAATPTPPEVEEAGQRSPSVEGRLLYARDGHIWLRTGTRANRLTRDINATQPCWSPDYEQIVFVASGNSYSDLWVMNADGGNPHPITHNRSAQAEYTRSYVHSSYWAAQPQWAPSNAIFYLSHPESRGNYSSQLAIWQIQPDGSSRSRYLSLSGHIENPAWSPDGQLLAFTLYTQEGAQLRYLRSGGGSVLALGEDAEGVERYDPAWSPDGQWIAYAARQDGQTDLWLMPSPLNPLFDGEWAPARLTGLGAARSPAWSPTGQQIAFVAADDGVFDLWLLTLEEIPGEAPQPAEVEQLTSGGQVDATARPSWAP